MAGITLAQAETKLTLWMETDDRVATSQAYTFPGGRALTRADTNQIQENIIFWEKKVERLTRGGIRVIGATPC
jgi:hypothetical protein